jgi:hypothetical protein
MYMKRLREAIRGNNRGSGIITVLVTLLFLSALGAALLFVSYTGYQIKLSERKSKENFYSADAAMSRIRSGLQQVVTESLASAYTNLLENYSDLSTAYEESQARGTPLADTLNQYLETKFKDEFENAFLQWKDADSNELFQKEKGSYTYSPSVLLNLMAPEKGATKFVDKDKNIYRVSAGGDTADLRCDGGVVIGSDDITLQGITVEYTGSNGYFTSITTDIAVKYPPFSYAPPAYAVSNLAGFAVIAKDALECSTHNVVLKGGAYAGMVSVDAHGASLTHEEGILVSAGDVTADNSGQFETSEHTALWAKGITVGNASVELLGNTYVADDLTLSGKQASAELQGNYYGFGNSNSDALNSSSILVNGRETSLDLSGLKSLMLAGTSFIDASGANKGNGKYMMGQSVAARSDQIAYLVPEECLPEGLSSNPYLVTGKLSDEQINGVISKLQSLQSSYSYYQYVDGVKDVYVHLNSTGGEMIAYLFLTFDSQEHANQYFKGYFSHHSDNINKYLGTYLDFYRSAPSVMGSGNTYTGTVTDGSVSDSGLENASSEDVLSAAAKQYQSQYKNLCSTLTTSLSSSAANPYEYIVNTAKVEELSDAVTKFTNDSGETVAVIVKGNCKIQDVADLDKLKIIIATGDVTVEKAFNGLIISGGTVTMRASLACDEGVSSALQAVDGEGETLLSYLNIGSNTGGSLIGGTGGSSWEVDDLVNYSEWRRH